MCRSKDKKDKRLRASAIVRYKGINILIDCGPDFRQQILRASSDNLDALLLTHIHYDHVAGIDDLRPYSFNHIFPIYARPEVNQQLRTNLPYCFTKHPYPGVPRLDLVDIDNNFYGWKCGSYANPCDARQTTHQWLPYRATCLYHRLLIYLTRGNREVKGHSPARN